MGIYSRRPDAFVAKVTIDGRSFHVGTYPTKDEAQAALETEYARVRSGTSVFQSRNVTYTVKDYAALIAVPFGTVNRWAHEGLPTVRAGRTLRIIREQADAWVAEHHANSVSFGRQGLLYVAERDVDAAVKIGWTSDLVRRMRELKRDTRAAVVLRAAVPGDKPDELRLHGRFAAHRIDGEWFRACPEIDAFLKALREVAA
jgi:excisionase family DNA binding protein